MTRLRPILILLGLALSLAGCTLPLGGTPSVPTATAPAPATPVVLNLEVQLLESFPVQAQAVVQGAAPDACTTIQAEVVPQGDTFYLQLQPQRQGICTPEPTLFTLQVPLPIEGLPAGTYRVVIGDLVRTFTLETDNRLPTQAAEGSATLTPQPTAAATASPTPTAGATPARIVGVVWEDRCTLQGGEGGVPVTPGPGCALRPGFGYGADGVRQSGEPGLAGVRVQLAQGACPGTPLTATLTDAQGRYAFEGLAPSTYCVRIDPLDGPNEQLLIPGAWSYPAPEVGQATLTLTAGAEATADFGWFRSAVGFVPAPEDCTLRAAFVNETIPDGTQVDPGVTFTKTWTLRNTGTCTWTEDYKAVRVGGDAALTSAEWVSLPQAVPPNAEVTIEVAFTAPQAPGTYRAEWQLEAPSGQRFGPGQDAQGRFWVEVEVPAQAAQLQLGAQVFSDPMNNPAYWFLLDEADARFEMSNRFQGIDGNFLVMHGLNPGMLDWWGLSAHQVPADGFLEATFVVGPACQGRDRYGVIVRAPDATQGIIVEFACNGEYRIYRWDGSQYTALKPWTHGGAIYPGPNQTNRLGVWLQGDTLRLYANRILLTEVTGNLYPSGAFGLVIGSANTPDFTVGVDLVEFWKLP